MMTKKTKTICSIIACLAIAAFIIYVGEGTSSSSMLRTVLQLGTIYALVAVSMNLLNGFTGLFSLGQAGFMAIGAYTYAVLTIPIDKKPNVYYLYGVNDALANIQLPLVLGLIAGGLVAALLAALVGAPVLRLKSLFRYRYPWLFRNRQDHGGQLSAEHDHQRVLGIEQHSRISELLRAVYRCGGLYRHYRAAADQLIRKSLQGHPGG